MTDKVQKIREEVERLKSQLLRGACSSQIAMETYCKEEAYNEVLSILDTMQEEPVSKVWHDMSESVENGRNIIIIDPADFYGAVLRKGGSQLKTHNKERYVKWAYIDDLLNLSNVERTIKNWKEEPVSGNIDFEKELYKAFGQVKDFTLGMQIAKRFYDMGRNSKEHVNEDKLEGLRNAFRLALDNEEPISDELEEAAVEWFNSVKYKSDLSGTLINAFKAGVQWQKEQEYTCYEEAFEDGASWKKEEMMEDAVNATVHIDSGNYPYIPQIELYDYDKDVPLAKEGDKYKVVLIKE